MNSINGKPPADTDGFRLRQPAVISAHIHTDRTLCYAPILYVLPFFWL